MSDLLTKCEVCSGLIDEEDLFCANCGTEAPQHEDVAQQHSRKATHNFECSGCGASMSYEAKAGTLRCPFCGSDGLKSVQDAKVLAPEAIVPFVIPRDTAVAAMRKYLGQGFFRPGDLSSKAAVVEMTPVYVPYWIFHAKTHTYWTADTSELPMMSRGDWRPMSGEHRGEHTNLLVGASGALKQNETYEICPFDMRQAVLPDQVDLDEVTVEQFSVQRKHARPLARQGIENREAKDCEQYVPSRCRNMQVNVRVEDQRSEPILLPVWVTSASVSSGMCGYFVWEELILDA